VIRGSACVYGRAIVGHAVLGCIAIQDRWLLENGLDDVEQACIEWR
jgi:hypothetical protein